LAEFNMGDVSVEELLKEVDQNNDGQIDYTEFVTMMRKGNKGGAGRSSLRNSQSLSLNDVLMMG
jgi:calcium-dependent protein kinase